VIPRNSDLMPAHFTTEDATKRGRYAGVVQGAKGIVQDIRYELRIFVCSHIHPSLLELRKCTQAARTNARVLGGQRSAMNRIAPMIRGKQKTEPKIAAFCEIKANGKSERPVAKVSNQDRRG